jgi:L-asparaginase
MQILFIQTGGTIDKDYPKTVKGYGFEITKPAVESILKKLPIAFKYKITSFLKKDSQEITEEDRSNLLKFCTRVKEDKIIITHGTDTMIQTAKYLSTIKNKTIILTGAMLPEKFKDSDAGFNLGIALGAIEYLGRGVYVAMNGRVYRNNKVKRESKTGHFIQISSTNKK